MNEKDCSTCSGEKDCATGRGEYSHTNNCFTCYKIIKQLVFTGLWVSLGMAFGVTGPTLQDLMQQLNINYEEISRALTGTSVGFFFGSIVGGVLFSLFYKHADLLTAVSSLSCTVGLLLVPWTRSLWHLGVCFILVGMSGGCINSGVNTLVLHLWGKKSGPPMYLLHFGFGIGGFAAPLIATRFISDFSSQHNVTSNSSAEKLSSVNNWTVMTTDEERLVDTFNASLFYPYSIIAVINSLCTLSMLLFYIRGPPKGFPSNHTKTPLKKLFSPKTCAPNHPAYAVVLLILLAAFFMQAVGAEIVYGNFIFSFATDAEVAFNKNQAAMLTSLFWFSHMTGRFIGAMLEICIPTSIILFCDVILLIITTLLLATVGYHNATALWILTACFGCLISPLYPAGMVWENAHIDVNAMGTMVLVAGSSAGLFFYVYVAGYMLEYFGPNSIAYFLVFCAFGLILVFIVLSIIGKRYLSIKEQEKERSDALLMKENNSVINN